MIETPKRFAMMDPISLEQTTAAAAAAAAAAPNTTKTINRRLAYLEKHHEYYTDNAERLAPILYDTMIRRYQTPEEREASIRGITVAGRPTLSSLMLDVNIL